MTGDWNVEWWLGRSVVFDLRAWTIVEADTVNKLRVLVFESKGDTDPTRLMLTLAQANTWLRQGAITLPN